MNGETLQEIKELLSEPGAIKTQTALRLSLQISSQIYDKLEDQKKEIKALEDKVKKVESASIVLWAQNNPKMALFIFVLYVLVSSSMNVGEAIAKALGY